MELSYDENIRLQIDNELDGFYDFVEIGRIGDYRIVQRESKTYKGLIDEYDNIIVPLIYDSIINVGEYIETKITIDNEDFVGVISKESMRIILPAIYKFINVQKNRNVISCYNGNTWDLVSFKNNKIKRCSLSSTVFILICVFQVQSRMDKQGLKTRPKKSQAFQEKDTGEVLSSVLSPQSSVQNMHLYSDLLINKKNYYIYNIVILYI